jgi:hypothetical protein
VLATCGIRWPELACENTQSRLLLLADSPEEEYNRKHSLAYLHKGVTYTVQRILTFVTRLTRFCLQLLHHRFVAWTTLDTCAGYLGHPFANRRHASVDPCSPLLSPSQRDAFAKIGENRPTSAQ